GPSATWPTTKMSPFLIKPRAARSRINGVLINPSLPKLASSTPLVLNRSRTPTRLPGALLMEPATRTLPSGWTASALQVTLGGFSVPTREKDSPSPVALGNALSSRASSTSRALSCERLVGARFTNWLDDGLSHFHIRPNIELPHADLEERINE